jgi:hypothetical protein
VSQVTQCYKPERARGSRRFFASDTVLLALRVALVVVLVATATGCGTAQAPVVRNGGVLLRGGDLAGWKAEQVEPGIAELAPELSGLSGTGRVEAPVLAHAGDAARATALVFATPADAARALARAKEPGYVAFLEHAFGGAVVARGPGVGYRLHVTRGSEPGSDTAELYVLQRGRAVALVELVSGAGFAPGTRNRLLALVGSRLSR